jgi:putative two-component system response regulator
MVLCDVEMPGINGFEVVRRVRGKKSAQELPVVMVTGFTGRQERIRAVEAGANDFINKPIDVTEIRVRLDSLLQLKDTHEALVRHKEELEERVKHRTAELRSALEEVKEAQHSLRIANLETIHRLVSAAEYKDAATSSHIQRMSQFCALLARRIHLEPATVEIILQASPMHDIGKIGVPEDILLKKGPLTDVEWEIMKKHTIIGADILKDSTSRMLKAGEVIALTHHEAWDGSGYPRGLKGKDIPLFGRICAVADVFDALTSYRTYKRNYSNKEALQYLKEGSGIQFDPTLVNAFAQNTDELSRIQEKQP